MKTIAVLNQKGGVGKTTIATHLAHALQLNAFDVLLIDTDPQGSARDWAAVRDDQTVPVVGIDRPTIDRDLQKITKKDFIIIDGVPKIYNLTISAIKAADFVLIPVQPSPYDIWTTTDLVDLVQQRIEATNGQLKAAFVINRFISGTKLGKIVNKALADYKLPVLETKITQRIIYANSANDGKTVMDLDPSGKAASEIKNLLDEILKILRT